MEMTKEMELYLEKVDNENAWDYDSIKNGAKIEIMHCINLWKECGKPIFSGSGTDFMGSGIEAYLLPMDIDGKLVFGAYAYEVEMEGMNDFKLGGEELPEVELIDINEIHTDNWDEDGYEDEDNEFPNFAFEGENFGDGNYYVYTNIEI